MSISGRSTSPMYLLYSCTANGLSISTYLCSFESHQRHLSWVQHKQGQDEKRVLTVWSWVSLFFLGSCPSSYPGSSYGLNSCLLYTSDAADERSSVDLGGRRIIKKKKKMKNEHNKKKKK